MSMIRRLLLLNLTYLTFVGGSLAAQNQLRVASPDGRNEVAVDVRDGRLYYRVQRSARLVIAPSMLGFEFHGAPPLRDGLRIVGSTRRSVDTTWTQPWGEVRRVRDVEAYHQWAGVPRSRPAIFGTILKQFDDASVVGRNMMNHGDQRRRRVSSVSTGAYLLCRYAAGIGRRLQHARASAKVGQ